MDKIVANNQQGVLAYPAMHYVAETDIQKAIESDKTVQTRVSNIQQSYYGTINVEDAMSKLAQVGELLQVAYAGSKVFPCARKIITILGEYQTLVHDSSFACSTFVQTALDALNSYSMVLAYAEENEFKDALELIGETANMSRVMGDEANKLMLKAEDLTKKSIQALEAATIDEVKTAADKQAAEKERDATRVRQEELQSLTTQLTRDVSNARDLEDKVREEAREVRSRKFALSLTSAILTPILGVVKSGVSFVTRGMLGGGESASAAQPEEDGIKSSIIKEILAAKAELLRQVAEKEKDKKAVEKEINSKKTDPTKQKEVEELEEALSELKKDLEETKATCNKLIDGLESQAKSCEERAALIEKRRAELEDRSRVANAELSAAVVKLQQSANTIDTLEQSICSLEIVVKTLGKVKTVFDNTRVYWLGIESNCKRMANTNLMERLAKSAEKKSLEQLDSSAPNIFKTKFLADVNRMGVEWLALGQVNYVAAKAIRGVAQGVDHIMSNLPDRNQRIQLIQIVGTKVLDDIKREDIATKAIA